MRTRLSVALAISLALASFVACSGAEPAFDSEPRGAAPAPGGTGSLDGGAPPVAPDGGTANDGGVGSTDGGPSTTRATVVGSVFDSWTNDPLPSFGVRLVGADGAVHDLATDAVGKFTAANVALPYDMGLIPEGSSAPRSAYLGVTNLTPQLRWTVDRPYALSSDVKVTVNAPDCGADECLVEVSVLTSDGYSNGASGVVPRSAPKYEHTATLRFDGAPTRTANVRAMVRDVAGTYYAFAETTISVTDGSTTLVPPLSPQQAPLAGTYSVDVELIGVPASWGPPRVSSVLALPGGASASLPSAESPFISFGLPQVVGGRVRSVASSRHPTRAYVSAQGWTKPQALGAAVVRPKLYGPPAILKPLDEGDVSVSDGIEWNDGVGVPALYSAVVASSTGALHFVTTDTRVSFQRLATLGLDVTPAADWRIRLGADRPFASVDALLTPSGSALSSDLFTSFSEDFRTFTLTP
ncbi:MAG: hypothetical protein JNL38_37130 [Myxococcales bacterium]|nr:hypothetical protein [Myxococcales bacterium]